MMSDNTNIEWFDVRKEPFTVHGLYDIKGEAEFRRLPASVADKLTLGAQNMSVCTSGGRIRFATDSGFIAIRTEMKCTEISPTFSRLSKSGSDLYRYDREGQTCIGLYLPPRDLDNGYEGIQYTDGKYSAYVINMPTYDRVTNFYIGIDKGARLDRCPDYRYPENIVYYGSSITQGALASRPGNIYQNFISRRFDTDYINFGLSGSALGEEAIAEYISGLKMSIFVLDYDHNAPNPEYLRKTHLAFYKTFRTSQPDTPVIMVTRPDFYGSQQDFQRRSAVYDTYKYAIDNGDKNVAFIDGELLYGLHDRDACTADRIHPSDIGFYRMSIMIGNSIAGFLQK